MAALPFVFFTNELHVLPLATIQSGQPPLAISIAKVFFKPQIEDIQSELIEVKKMGSATAEEWLKGLDDRGKERRNDAARWEKWEVAGGVARMRYMEAHEVGNITAQTNDYASGSKTIGLVQSKPVLNGHIQTPQSQNFLGFATQAPQTSVPPRAFRT